MTKESSYNFRELEAVKTADRLIIRRLINKHWDELHYFPKDGESLLECLKRAQIMIADDNRFAQAVLYIGNETMMAVLPRSNIPAQVEEILKTR